MCSSVRPFNRLAACPPSSSPFSPHSLSSSSSSSSVNDSVIPLYIKNQLVEMIAVLGKPDGLNIANIVQIWRHHYGTDLNFRALGFQKVSHFLESVQGLKLRRVEGTMMVQSTATTHKSYQNVKSTTLTTTANCSSSCNSSSTSSTIGTTTSSTSLSSNRNINTTNMMPMKMTREQYMRWGFERISENQLLENAPSLICPICCCFVVHKPKISKCGHCFCSECIDKWFDTHNRTTEFRAWVDVAKNISSNKDKGREAPCPCCMSMLSQERDLKTVSPRSEGIHLILWNIIKNLEIRCKNEYCDWNGVYGDYIMHLISCKWEGQTSRQSPPFSFTTTTSAASPSKVSSTNSSSHLLLGKTEQSFQLTKEMILKANIRENSESSDNFSSSMDEKDLILLIERLEEIYASTPTPPPSSHPPISPPDLNPLVLSSSDSQATGIAESSSSPDRLLYSCTSMEGEAAAASTVFIGTQSDGRKKDGDEVETGHTSIKTNCFGNSGGEVGEMNALHSSPPSSSSSYVNSEAVGAVFSIDTLKALGDTCSGNKKIRNLSDYNSPNENSISLISSTTTPSSLLTANSSMLVGKLSQIGSSSHLPLNSHQSCDQKEKMKSCRFHPHQPHQQKRFDDLSNDDVYDDLISRGSCTTSSSEHYSTSNLANCTSHHLSTNHPDYQSYHLYYRANAACPSSSCITVPNVMKSYSGGLSSSDCMHWNVKESQAAKMGHPYPSSSLTTTSSTIDLPLSSASSYCVCYLDFEGIGDSQLSLHANDMVEVIQRKESGWTLGRKINTTTFGWFPQYVLNHPLGGDS